MRVLGPRLVGGIGSKDFKSQLSQVAKYRVRSDVRWTSMWTPQRETESRLVEWSECERNCREDCGIVETLMSVMSVKGEGPLKELARCEHSWHDLSTLCMLKVL